MKQIKEIKLEKECKIINKLTYLIEERLNKGLLIKISDIKEIIEYFIEVYQVDDIVKECTIDLDGDKRKPQGYYDINGLSLYFNEANIRDSILKRYQFALISEQIPFHNYYNYHFLVALLHEFNHVLQFKDILNDCVSDKQIVLDLYKLSHALLRNRDLYREYRDLFPNEREAIISSNATLLSCFQSLDPELVGKNPLRLYQLETILGLLKDYKKGIRMVSPFQQLMKESDEPLKKHYERILKEEYISLYRRLELGLPIDKKEYYRLCELYHDINESLVPVQESVKKIILRRG